MDKDKDKISKHSSKSKRSIVSLNKSITQTTLNQTKFAPAGKKQQ